MSVQQVSSALERFISEQEAKAIVLKGDWGLVKLTCGIPCSSKRKRKFHVENIPMYLFWAK